MGHVCQNEVPDASSWILDVAFPPWYQVDMTMEDRLSRRLAAVDADVEAIDGRIIILKQFFLSDDQSVRSVDLGLEEPEIVNDVALWNDEGVHRRDREPITDDESQFVLVNYPALRNLAEGTT
jgi:hypothetical protein